MMATHLNRDRIVRRYAEWTALSALRSGAPVKSREHIYPALRKVQFGQVLSESIGAIDAGEFEHWHRHAVRQLSHELEVRSGEPVCVGWSAKLVNIYLKTAAYVAGRGRSGLHELLHPPIDAGLWAGIRSFCSDDAGILERTHCVTRIKDIVDYDEHYSRIIAGCRAVAVQLGCALIEVESLWRPDATSTSPTSPLWDDFSSIEDALDQRIALYDADVRRCVYGSAVDMNDGLLRVRLDDGVEVPIDYRGRSRLGRWTLLGTEAGQRFISAPQ
ncbi:MAG: hypothetical protein ACLGIK_05770 [Gemmatimonadota bacterium]